jgi:hypothetical protein
MYANKAVKVLLLWTPDPDCGPVTVSHIIKTEKGADINMTAISDFVLLHGTTIKTDHERFEKH